MDKSDQIILGVDPGTSIMGYGLIHNKGNKIELITMGVINLSKYSNHYIKLKVIFERMKGIIDEYHPDLMSIEAPFFGKNVQSMLKLGRAQGVCIAAAVYRDLPIVEYSPKKIKKAITGNGNASKEQVALMLKTTVKLKVEPEFLDATDALAAAVCHSYQNTSLMGDKSYSDWSAFAKKNSDRIK